MLRFVWRRSVSSTPPEPVGDLRIRNLLDYPELQAVMTTLSDVNGISDGAPVTPVRLVEQHRRAAAELFDVAA